MNDGAGCRGDWRVAQDHVQDEPVSELANLIKIVAQYSVGAGFKPALLLKNPTKGGLQIRPYSDCLRACSESHTRASTARYSNNFLRLVAYAVQVIVKFP